MEERWLDHHSAYFNGAKIIYNLELLGEHYALDPCRECIGKHLQTIIAYAQEGALLDHAEEMREFLEAAESLAVRHLSLVLECAVKENGKCELHGPADVMRLAQEARALRREMNVAIFGFAADLMYESDGVHGHSHEEPEVRQEEHEEPDVR